MTESQNNICAMEEQPGIYIWGEKRKTIEKDNLLTSQEPAWPATFVLVTSIEQRAFDGFQLK